MNNIKINTGAEANAKLESYPKEIKPKVIFLRDLIIKTASEIETITEIEETLKWGEPSYLVKGGSTIRIDWKEKSPNQYAMYFKCTSKLVPTFKELFSSDFKYEKNRAIIFELNHKIPTEKLKVCIGLALTYHLVKNLPKLGYDLS